MSRSNNTEVKNPAVKFFQWSGDEGKINYYDKELKERVEVSAPFTFLVLDKLITMTGYNDDEKSGYWSNEIRNTKTDVLTVRTKSGIKKSGLYDQVKSLVGAKFAQSVYIAFYDEEKNLQIGNFKFNGCAVSAWIEFCKGKDIYQGAITIIGAGPELTKGKTKYFAPEFEVKETVSESTNEKALELDRELQKYLTAYFALRGETEPALAGSDYIQARNAEINAFPDNPIAKSLSELITAKQLGLIRALARELGIDPDEECQNVLSCKTDELSKNAANALIQHLQDLQNNQNDSLAFSGMGESSMPDDDIPF